MTTYQVAEDAELAGALGELVAVLQEQHDPAVAYVSELRSAATPGNGFSGPAAVPFHARAHIAAVARRVAADGGPHAGHLEGLADGLVGSLAMYRANGGRF